VDKRKKVVDVPIVPDHHTKKVLKPCKQLVLLVVPCTKVQSTILEIASTALCTEVEVSLKQKSSHVPAAIFTLSELHTKGLSISSQRWAYAKIHGVAYCELLGIVLPSHP
jgi:hypothetical protein